MTFSVFERSGLWAAFLLFAILSFNGDARADIPAGTGVLREPSDTDHGIRTLIVDNCEGISCLETRFDRELIEGIKANAINNNLSSSAVWTSLIHVENYKPKILDPAFTLSVRNFSIEAELVKTIDYLYSGDEKAVCRFPARYLFIRMSIGTPKLPIENCDDIVEFFERAPGDELAVVFASENLTSPASMMGHSFIKISGYSSRLKRNVSHAISFYTDTNTINIPYLLYESLVLGTKGYFSLSPYEEKLERYVDIEQRNIWEYKLRLSDNERHLILLHLMELKGVDFKYFFHSYNCATVIDFILGITARNNVSKGFWVTPRDIVRGIVQRGLAEPPKLVSSQRWIFRSLGPQLKNDVVANIKKNVIRREDEDEKIEDIELGYKVGVLSAAFNDYALNNKLIDKEKWGINRNRIAKRIDLNSNDFEITVGVRNVPESSPQDSQIMSRLVQNSGSLSIDFSFTPISHHIYDDNRVTGIENELILFEPRLSYSERDGLKMDRLIFYSIQSLAPHDSFSGGLSGRFRVGVERELIDKDTKRTNYYLSGSIGKTTRVTNGIDVFYLAGLVTGFKSIPYITGTADVGIIVRQAGGIKSILEIRQEFGRTDSENATKVQLMTSVYLDKNHSAHFEIQKVFHELEAQSKISLGIKRIF